MYKDVIHIVVESLSFKGRINLRVNGCFSLAFCAGSYVASMSIALAWKVYLGEARPNFEEAKSGKIFDSERTTEYKRDKDGPVRSSELYNSTSRASSLSRNKRAQLYKDLERRQRSRASSAQTVISGDASPDSQLPEVRSMLMSFLPQHSEARKILLDSKIGEKALGKKPEFLGENCIEFIDIYHEAVIEAIIQHNPDMSVVHKQNR